MKIGAVLALEDVIFYSSSVYRLAVANLLFIACCEKIDITFKYFFFARWYHVEPYQ